MNLSLRSVRLLKKTALTLVLPLCVLFLSGPGPALAGEPVSISGITEPMEDVTLSLDASGMISAIHYKEGALVKKGKVILELDSKLDLLEVARRQLVWESKVELNSSIFQAQTLKSLYDTTKALYENNKSVSQEELLKIELEYKLAVSERERLKIVEQREKYEYQMAVVNLEKRKLVSPITGVIIKLFFSRGENIEVRQALVHMVDTAKGRFVCNIEEKIGRGLKRGQIVKLKIKSGSGSVMKKGKVSFVSPVVDPASGLFEVKVEFENFNRTIRPGSSGWMLLD